MFYVLKSVFFSASNTSLMPNTQHDAHECLIAMIQMLSEHSNCLHFDVLSEVSQAVHGKVANEVTCSQCKIATKRPEEGEPRPIMTFILAVKPSLEESLKDFFVLDTLTGIECNKCTTRTIKTRQFIFFTQARSADYSTEEIYQQCKEWKTMFRKGRRPHVLPIQTLFKLYA